MLTIGKLSEATGVKVPTIRYYEGVGIWHEADRSAGKQRLYGRMALDSRTFIRHARELGFPLDAIRDLLRQSNWPGQCCAAADAINCALLAAAEGRIARLNALKAELESLVCNAKEVPNALAA